MSEANGSTRSPITLGDTTPLPNDFLHYFPYACGQFQCGVDVRINKMLMSDFVGTVKTERFPQRATLMKNLKSHLSRMTITSECGFLKTIDSFTSDPAIVITATYNLSDRLTHLKFHNTTYLPRKLIKVLRLIVHFHHSLTSITCHHRINKYVIYELSKLLNESNISEVCLDGCSVRDGCFELLLADNTGIRILSLARCTLADPIIDLFAQRLVPPYTASKTLLMLNLSSNRLTDKSAKSLANALRVNRCLRHLNLSDNAITDKGAIDILDTMLKMTVTESELFTGREERFKYLKDKMKVMNELIQEITIEEIEKLRRNLSKSNQKKNKSIIGSVSESDPFLLSGDIRQNIATRAALTAEATIGKFNHPFYPLINKDGVVTCFGNNTLHSLNLAYNNLSILSVRKILDVMNYQQLRHRKPRGLVNVNLEGNNLPVSCPEYNQINALMVAYSDGREDRALSIVSTRKRLRTFNSKASVNQSTD